MKRSAILAPLSREHHLALVWAKRARSYAASDVESFAESLVSLFDATFEPHFRKEEGELPSLLVAQPHLIKRMLDEHELLRHQINLIRNGRRDLIGDFGLAMEQHVRFEERELFPTIERSVGQSGTKQSVLPDE